MTDKAAFIYAHTVAAQAEIEGMKALNSYRINRGETIAYVDENFTGVQDELLTKINRVYGDSP